MVASHEGFYRDPQSFVSHQTSPTTKRTRTPGRYCCLKNIYATERSQFKHLEDLIFLCPQLS